MLQSLQKSGVELTNMQRQRLSWLEQYDLYILAWIPSLPEDEAYVIQRHLVDGIDWPRIATEYNLKWENSNAKADRTLMFYQKRGINRIVDSFDTSILEPIQEFTI